MLLICQILIRFNGVDIGTEGSRITLSGFKALTGGVVGLGVNKAELAPATQILPSKSIAKDVTISFGLEEDDITPMFVATVNANTTLIHKNGGDLLCELDFYTVELIFKHMNKLSGKMLLTRGEE